MKILKKTPYFFGRNWYILRLSVFDIYFSTDKKDESLCPIKHRWWIKSKRTILQQIILFYVEIFLIFFLDIWLDSYWIYENTSIETKFYRINFSSRSNILKVFIEEENVIKNSRWVEQEKYNEEKITMLICHTLVIGQIVLKTSVIPKATFRYSLRKKCTLQLLKSLRQPDLLIATKLNTR